MMDIISPNMIKTYLTCAKKFYYRYVEHLSIPTSASPFEKGKKIHALANYYLQGINISRIETALNEQEKLLWEILKQNSYFLKECYKSEYQLSCKTDKFWIGGRIDAVMKDNDNYYILDYKTGSIPKNPAYDPQTMIYLLCMDKMLKNYNELSFVYINLKENNNSLIKFNKETKTVYEKEVVKLCSTLTEDTLYKDNTTECKHCEYKNVCCHY